ncbi:hypothetical protein [Pseudofulvibacter geojedonensis]|uniref:Lipoprotein n=1 Tax=Pseudofulvibacter geojedonensis TaxID=1123758 RepID=A0ABW3I0L7_9FLAO
MKKLFILTLSSLTFIQCAKKTDPFLIQKDKIGVLERNYTVKQIDSVFANDSIVKRVAGDEFAGSSTDIEIYEKGGKHLLSLSPSETLDDNATINIVTINDDRFKTDKGINLNSTFLDFTTHYEVSKIDRILNNINVEFKNQDFYITISIDELPGAYKYDFSKTIEIASIPDKAKIKSLRLDWF